MEHKSGFINIVGSPNVGKSTLMNALIGERLAIITSKAQTTRQRILGIVNGDDFQMVFSDTPGIVKPAYKLHEKMMQYVHSSLSDADILLFVTDVFEKEFEHEKVFEQIKQTEAPILLLLNKMDLATEEVIEERKQYWSELLPQAKIVTMAALHYIGIEEVLNTIISLLPESPPYFPKDQLTDKPERFFIAEMIREKIFLNYRKEIPYSCEVIIESFKETKDIVRVRAEIMVERDSQKGIIIGHQGKPLKKVGTEARIDMEHFLQKKVYLEMFVKVDKDWRNNEKQLKRYGYVG